jgi:hypothetical protein
MNDFKDCTEVQYQEVCTNDSLDIVIFRLLGHTISPIYCRFSCIPQTISHILIKFDTGDSEHMPVTSYFRSHGFTTKPCLRTIINPFGFSLFHNDLTGSGPHPTSYANETDILSRGLKRPFSIIRQLIKYMYVCMYVCMYAGIHVSNSQQTASPLQRK